MNPELLAIDLEELARRIESEAHPRFLMVPSDRELIERVNDQARALGFVPDFIMRFQLVIREDGSGDASVIIRDPYWPHIPEVMGDRWDVAIEHKWGDRFPDWVRCPIPRPASYAEHLRRWAHWVRSEAATRSAVQATQVPEVDKPVAGLSNEAAALLDVLRASRVKLTGKELVAKLSILGVFVDEVRISRALVPELREAGVCVQSMRGSPGYWLQS